MATIETQLTPREILNRLYERLRRGYDALLSAAPGDAKADEKILEEIEGMGEWIEKLEYSFIKKLKADANIDSQSFEKLAELEALLEKLALSEKDGVRKGHYLYRTAKRVRNVVKGQKRKAQSKGIKEIGKIKQQERRLDLKKEKAKELVGKKR